MKYQIAIQETQYEQVAFVRSTNCIDKRNGHYFSWLSKKDEPEKYAEIIKEHPSLNQGCICVCVKCGKVT